MIPGNIKNHLLKNFNPFVLLLIFVSAFYGKFFFGYVILKGDVFAYQLPEKFLIR